jgi:hypothetical protein
MLRDQIVITQKNIPYKILWVSVTDLGSIKYEKGVRNTYDLNTVSQADYDTADNFDDFIKSNYAYVVNGTVKSFYLLPCTPM